MRMKRPRTAPKVQPELHIPCQMAWYLHNCAISPLAPQINSLLIEQLETMWGDPEIELDDDLPAPLAAPTRHILRRNKTWLLRLRKEYPSPPKWEDNCANNIRLAQQEFELDDIEASLLRLVIRYEQIGVLEQFADKLLSRLSNPNAAFAALLGLPTSEVQERLKGDRPLLACGLLFIADAEVGYAGLAGQSGYLQLAGPLRKVMAGEHASIDVWREAMFGPPLSVSLEWKDFEHIGPMRDLAAQLLAGAGRNQSVGVNLLLHGPVGTGKTEFAKALAAHTGMQIWSVTESDRQGGEPERSERLAGFRLAQCIFARRKNVLLLVDEAEDVLAGNEFSFGRMRNRERIGSKVYLNRLIEQNPVPTLWTCNDTSAIDPALLRRLALAIEIDTPNQPVRARIWRRVLGDTRLDLGEAAVQRLATRYAAPPAVAASAARTAMLSDGGEAEIDLAMGAVLPLLGIAPEAPQGDGAFDPELTRCDSNLAALTAQLVRPGASRQWSMCLHGAPGTGKSQFARFLAGRLGMDVMQRRASDLLSCWVGDSEKQIAEAFRTARNRRMLLVIDEADSLLSDRREARNSWEVTQVNEMLTWMEQHPLPFICTTNLMARLDQASLRRFTLKLRFDPLTPGQASLAFQRFFGMPAPGALADDLTPGDFANVRRRRDLFGEASPAVLAAWLAEETAAKGAPSRPIGFTRH